ncbi:MAG TPA: glycosyltransferase family 2 protein, partial [Chthoniobacterales bacterium]
MNATPAIAVVIPFFNEEPNVVEVCRELRQVLPTEFSDIEVALIDDGSTDGTAAILDRVASDWPEARVYHLPENQGQSAALLFGFRRTSAPIVVTMDGDGQNDPADIGRLLARLDEADMVVGARVNRRDSWMRRKISRIANVVRSALLGDGVSDAGCALKVFRRQVVGSFIPIRTLYSFMPALAVADGFRVVEEPVRHRPRHHGASRYSVASFLFLPIVDFIGLRWFRSRRVRDRALAQPRETLPLETLGLELYRRELRRWARRGLAALGLGILLVLVLLSRKSGVNPEVRKISLRQAEKIALQLVP